MSRVDLQPALLMKYLILEACMRPHFPRVLCVCFSAATLERLRRSLSGLTILSALSGEQALAVCVSEAISLAIIDGECERGYRLSVAQSLKLVRPSLPVILLEEKADRAKPENINAIVETQRIEDNLANVVRELLFRS